MDKKGVQFPLTFIIFLVVMIIIVGLLLVWNFSGFEQFTKAFGSAGGLVNETSGGAVTTLLP
ncbi:MAG: hypothetical protein PHH61_01920 [Candidatus Nanoarchaeia archaeon]|nr:hypothetical protein [Candidatus Nanoarchaeia archaeon]